MRETAILIDIAEISRIMSLSGIEGLNVLAQRGDYFFLSKDALNELADSNHFNDQKYEALRKWIKDPNIAKKIRGVSKLTDKEKEIYDPKGKRHSRRGGERDLGHDGTQVHGSQSRFRF
ncbi:hypothetical protein [uncultured Roseibium sp.]|uniref:hypothetical protein n=1 Tax=uncultured Roseibium sp. TaxID=1936171 RepID=UPI00261DD7C7|nr:hypothetical protein [uncultured Roseibium sp.]